MSVVIETTIGDITVDLYLKERPNTCLNFLKLCKMKYYNFCLFYKVERNFIAQTGDPTSTGRGGESVFCHLYGDQAKYFDAECKPRLKHEKFGTLSMVNNGNNMNGSQFFITLGEKLTFLDNVHSVFGEVVEGFDILMKLNEAICDSNNRPYQDIRITHTVILHDPFNDPSGLEIPDRSPEPTKDLLESNYIRADEEIDDTKGKTAEEIEEKIKESEAKARATILEMVGDIPDVDVKPPENVLFVCKLNPVTTSEDLEIIFSRFGHIISCEVIKDKKTDESLQYAFIEFEKEEDCENAYFKMDNVLIDDRRIHVDFSQSVSKLFYKDKNSSKPGSLSSRNLVLKHKDKSDGYDMVFDVSDSENVGKNEKKTQKKESIGKYSAQHKSFRDKNKHSSSSNNYPHTRKSSERSPNIYKNLSFTHEKKSKLHKSDSNSCHSESNKIVSSRSHYSDKDKERESERPRIKSRLSDGRRYVSECSKTKAVSNKYRNNSSSSESSPSKGKHRSNKESESLRHLKEYSSLTTKLQSKNSSSKIQHYDKEQECEKYPSNQRSSSKKYSDISKEIHQHQNREFVSEKPSSSKSKNTHKYHSEIRSCSSRNRHSSDVQSLSDSSSVDKHFSGKRDKSYKFSRKHHSSVESTFSKTVYSNEYSSKKLTSNEPDKTHSSSDENYKQNRNSNYSLSKKSKYSSYPEQKSKKSKIDKTRPSSVSSEEDKFKRKQITSSCSTENRSDSSSYVSQKYKKSKKHKSSHKKYR